MAPDDSTHHPDDTASREQLPVLRRSFPVPKRTKASVAEESVSNWLHQMLGVAVLTAATLAWSLWPDNTPSPAPPVIAEPEIPPSGPPDAARDIYLDRRLTEVAAPPPVVAEIPPAEIPPALPLPFTRLDDRYLGALTAAMRHVPEADRAPFTAEIERLQSGAPLPPPQDGIHPELDRLQSIYRLKSLKENSK